MSITIAYAPETYKLVDEEFRCTHENAYIISGHPADFDSRDTLMCPNPQCDGHFTDEDFERVYHYQYAPAPSYGLDIYYE